MRHIVGLFAITIGYFSASTAEAQETARTVVDRAMKARCEKVESLAKQKIEIILMEGKIDWKMGDDAKELTARREFYAEWPKRFRFNYEIHYPMGKESRSMVLDGDKGWQSPGFVKPVEDLSEISLDEMKMEVHGYWTTTLYPLTDKSFTLTLLQPTKFNGEDVAVVKATMRFRPEVYLFFSKKTGHLVKAGYMAREVGVELRKEHAFPEYKSFEGIELPSKLIDYRDGKKIAEYSITSYKFLDKLDDGALAKPAKE